MSFNNEKEQRIQKKVRKNKKIKKKEMDAQKSDEFTKMTWIGIKKEISK